MDFFFADEPEREDWNGLLRMAEFVTVQGTDGQTHSMDLAHHPPEDPAPPPAFQMLGDEIALLRCGRFDGEGRTAALARAHEEQLRRCRALILDLRNGGGDDEEEAAALLPLLCQTDTSAAELLDTKLYVNYTRLNCLLKAAGLQALPDGRTYISELVQKAGAGFLPEDTGENDIIPGRAPSRVAVLTDTWCRDAGELLAQAAQRAGARLIGRPTLGTIDFCGDVHYALDDRYILTWPTAVTKSAYEGHGILGKGIAPDEYIPWTPRELTEDLLLAAAVRTICEQ